MTYVDGYVLAVPTARKEDYRKLAAEAAQVFREHGALAVVECWGDDVPAGETASFPMAVKAGPDETVVFSWIIWMNKPAREAGNEKVMHDPRMQPPEGKRLEDIAPFDTQRMITGGFEAMIEA